MKTEDIKRMALAYQAVTEKKMDPVGQEDGDIDNDGDKDKSDKYLHNRRKTIKKAMTDEGIGDMMRKAGRKVGSAIHKAADELSGEAQKRRDQEANKAVWTKLFTKQAELNKHIRDQKKQAELNKAMRAKKRAAQAQKESVSDIQELRDFQGSATLSKHWTYISFKNKHSNKDDGGGEGSFGYQNKSHEESDRIIQHLHKHYPGKISKTQNRIFGVGNPGAGHAQVYVRNKHVDEIHKAIHKAGGKVTHHDHDKVNESYIQELHDYQGSGTLSKHWTYISFKNKHSDKDDGGGRGSFGHDTKAHEESDRIIQHLHKNYPDKISKTQNRIFRSGNPGAGHAAVYVRNKHVDEIHKAIHKAGGTVTHHDHDKVNESLNLDQGNVNTALKHDCATHVTSEHFGPGTCISGMHTIKEQADGTCIVTHYDVLFEHGIEEMVPVSELKITRSESHMHARKKMKEETVAEDYGAMKDAEAHAAKNGENYARDTSVQHRYDAYHMKKAGYTHFEPQSHGNRRYTKGPTAHPSSTKIGPEHHSGVSESVEEMPANESYVRPNSVNRMKDALISVWEEAGRAAHYKGATPPEPMTKPEARSEKKMKDGHPIDSEGKISNYEYLGHDDASKAGRVTKKSPMRKGDNAASDKMQAPVDTTKKGGFSEMVHSITAAYRSMYEKKGEE